MSRIDQVLDEGDYMVHYLGYSKKFDEVLGGDQLKKMTDEAKAEYKVEELAREERSTFMV